MTAAKRKTILIALTGLAIVLTSVTLFAFYNSTVTVFTTGKIIDVKKLKLSKIKGRLDEITYVYSVNGKDYACKQSVGVRFPRQSIGNRVKVEYKKKNPEQSEATGFYLDFKNSDNRVEFHAAKKYGYHNIELINDLYFYTNYADSGKVIERIVGKYTIYNDTLYVTPYNIGIENKYRKLKYVLVETPDRARRFGIKNVSNSRIFQ